MLSAKEAKTITENAINDINGKLGKELLVVLDGVKQAALTGANTYNRYDYVNPIILDKLEKLGYTVKQFSDRNEYRTNVSW
jgi:hypothetical protein